MGKAVKWFRGLLGLKKHESPLPPTLQSRSASKSIKEKRKWSFVKSYREKDSQTAMKHREEAREVNSYGVGDDEKIDPNKHAIAVAAATAAVAEAAVAAAQAAAAVVRLTSSGRCGNSLEFVGGRYGDRKELAAVRIQSTFRGYLGRKALRALKAVVRLQALVRGHIERKRTAAWLQRMQALLRAQARARAGRAQYSESLHSSGKSSQFHHPGPATPEKLEHVIRVKSVKYDQSSVLKRNGSNSNGRVVVDQDKAYVGGNKSDRRMDERSWDQKGPSMRTGSKDDENSDKILEIDTGKPHFTPNCRNLFHTSQHALASDQNSHSYTTSKESIAQQTVLSPSSCEVQSSSPLKFSHMVEDNPFGPADHSPQFFSASSRGNSSRRSPFTPTKSDSSRSYLSEYALHPNFMAYTESSKAKARSLSAPKQRPQFEKSSSIKRYSSVHSFGEPKSNMQKISALNANIAGKAYPGSGRLDRLGMPVGFKY